MISPGAGHRHGTGGDPLECGLREADEKQRVAAAERNVDSEGQLGVTTGGERRRGRVDHGLRGSAGVAHKRTDDGVDGAGGAAGVSTVEH